MAQIDWRQCGFVGLFLVALAMAAPAMAQGQQMTEQCENKNKQYSLDVMIAACTQAIQSGQWSGSNLAWAFNNRGNAYADKQDEERALADFGVAIQLNPTYALAYYNRGTIYHDRRDHSRAIADYSASIQYNPDYLPAYRNRGLVYEDMGDRDRAIADFRIAYARGHPKAGDDLRRLGVTP